MSKAVLVARLLLGFLFTFFGLNHFFNFVAMPPLGEDAGAYMAGLSVAGYMWPTIKILEIAGGLMLLLGRFVPLGLTLLAPIVYNIAAFYFTYLPGGPPIPLVVLVLALFLAWGAPRRIPRHPDSGRLRPRRGVPRSSGRNPARQEKGLELGTWRPRGAGEA